MTNRFHSLDFLRAFALLMGVLLHVLMLFLEPFDGSEPRFGASIVFIWIHSWRMPLFMVLAGFFTALSLFRSLQFVSQFFRVSSSQLWH